LSEFETKHAFLPTCGVILVAKRTNEEWIAALSEPGPEYDDALSDLRALLVRGLGYALTSRSGIDDAILEDFAQDALLKILAGLDSFRGESQFTTWAQKIAVRVAYTELRRHRWRDVSLDEMTDVSGTDFVPSMMADPAVGPEQQAIQQTVLETMRRVIDEELTEKQRQALVGVRIQGMPLEEIAHRMGTNRNALYKLLHDARQRLKQGLMAQGLSPDEILAAFE
jgi:RNA polymerase sigma-70 factor (ECF subfamily)